MLNFTSRLALLCLLGSPLLSLAAQAQEKPAPVASQVDLTLPLPLAPEAMRGYRPRLNPTLVTPAATKLAPGVENLPAPASLALPVKPEQVRITELRPLGLVEVENLAEVNNPDLKAIASKVDQAQSNLRAQISQWYPKLDLEAGSVPSYSVGQSRSVRAAGNVAK